MSNCDEIKSALKTTYHMEFNQQDPVLQMAFQDLIFTRKKDANRQNFCNLVVKNENIFLSKITTRQYTTRKKKINTKINNLLKDEVIDNKTLFGLEINDSNENRYEVEKFQDVTKINTQLFFWLFLFQTFNSNNIYSIQMIVW